MISNVSLANDTNQIALDKVSLNQIMDQQLQDQTANSSLDLDSLTVGASVDPDSTYTFEQLADEYGFTADSYQVTTEDGYELKMFRLKQKGATQRG